MKLINAVNRFALCCASAALLVSSPPLAATPPPDYCLVFSDEFDTAHLDESKWVTTMAFAGAQGGRYHNVAYLNYNLDENIALQDGLLRLKADKQNIVGVDPVGLYQYSGALISTDGKFSFTYGYVEMRAKYPGGRGLWPVFWLMPQAVNAWPPEFDIAEYYAGSSVMHHGLCHGDVRDPLWDSTGDTASEAELAFHTYGLEWSPGRAVWYEDGIVKKVIEAEYVPSLPMYVILNNGVSSRFGPSGAPNDKTPFPNYFEVDYVRVYQHPPSPAQPLAREPAAAAAAASATPILPGVVATLP